MKAPLTPQNQDISFKLSRTKEGVLTVGARVEIRNMKGKRGTADL